MNVCNVFNIREKETVGLNNEARGVFKLSNVDSKDLMIEKPRQLSYAIGVAKPLSLFVGRPSCGSWVLFKFNRFPSMSWLILQLDL